MWWWRRRGTNKSRAFGIAEAGMAPKGSSTRRRGRRNEVRRSAAEGGRTRPLEGAPGGPVDAVAATGVVYIADTQNQRVRAVAPGGAVATVAGTGVAGFNGEIVSPRAALLNRPQGIAADAFGNWYIADTVNNRVRKVQPGGNL